MKTVPVFGSVEGLHGLKDLEVILAVEDKLVRWDLNVPKKLEEVRDDTLVFKGAYWISSNISIAILNFSLLLPI